jgi:hypothetical protein
MTIKNKLFKGFNKVEKKLLNCKNVIQLLGRKKKESAVSGGRKILLCRHRRTINMFLKTFSNSILFPWWYLRKHNECTGCRKLQSAYLSPSMVASRCHDLTSVHECFIIPHRREHGSLIQYLSNFLKPRQANIFVFCWAPVQMTIELCKWLRRCYDMGAMQWLHFCLSGIEEYCDTQSLAISTTHTRALVIFVVLITISESRNTSGRTPVSTELAAILNCKRTGTAKSEQYNQIRGCEFRIKEKRNI